MTTVVMIKKIVPSNWIRKQVKKDVEKVCRYKIITYKLEIKKRDIVKC